MDKSFRGLLCVDSPTQRRISPVFKEIKKEERGGGGGGGEGGDLHVHFLVWWSELCRLKNRVVGNIAEKVRVHTSTSPPWWSWCSCYLNDAAIYRDSWLGEGRPEGSTCWTWILLEIDRGTLSWSRYSSRMEWKFIFKDACSELKIWETMQTFNFFKFILYIIFMLLK